MTIDTDMLVAANALCLVEEFSLSSACYVCKLMKLALIWKVQKH